MGSGASERSEGPVGGLSAIAPFAVSIVVLAIQSDSDIGATLASLRAQTWEHWDAIVIDDGSRDDSARIVERIAAQDQRIRLLRVAHAEPSEARNAGVLASAHPWLLFLEAGDTIAATLLGRVHDLVAVDRALDAVHYGWAIVDSAGSILVEERCDATGDLFDLLARQNAFPSHACVVRRLGVEEAGGFNPAMRLCDDWVLWQRIARRGGRFGRIAQSLSFSERGPRSLSADLAASLDCGLMAIETGHSPDPTVGLASGAPYVAGRLVRSDEAVLNAVCWAASASIALGRDPRALLSRLAPGHRTIDTESVAEAIVHAAPTALARRRESWGELWAEMRAPLDDFLAELESRIARPGVARDVAIRVQRAVLEFLSPPLPDPVVGSQLGVVEITEPIADVMTASTDAVVQILVRMEGATLGVIEIASTEGRVSAFAVRDAVASRFAWTILGRFFERSAYADIRFRDEQGGSAAYRGQRVVARGLPVLPSARWSALHEAIGWQTFRDQLWQRDHPVYSAVADLVDRASLRINGIDDGRSRGAPRALVADLSKRVPLFLYGRRNITAELRYAGGCMSSVELVLRAGVLSGRAVRGALTSAAGFELCRVVVRDALLGAPLDPRITLHDRVARV